MFEKKDKSQKPVLDFKKYDLDLQGLPQRTPRAIMLNHDPELSCRK